MVPVMMSGWNESVRGAWDECDMQFVELELTQQINSNVESLCKC